MRLKQWRRGFAGGFFAGVIWLFWVYRRAEQFPGDLTLNRYYLWLRRMD